MSILTENLPNYLMVLGEKCPINTDFKIWLEFSNIVSKGELDTVKIVKIFKLIFLKLPPNLVEGMKAISEFYGHASNTGTDVKEDTAEKAKKYFDFEYDSELIYSAFLQQYKIDLTEATMHWWKFKALFQSLSEDTQLIQVIKYRSIKLSDIKNKEQKRFYAKMKKLHRLPDNRSEEQKERDLLSAFELLF